MGKGSSIKQKKKYQKGVELHVDQNTKIGTPQKDQQTACNAGNI